MTHFGIVCPAATGHLNTFLPIGQKLKERGHKVTVINFLDAQARVVAANLDFSPIGTHDFPLGSMDDPLAEMGKTDGLTALRHAIALFGRKAAAIMEDAPQIIKTTGIDVLLIDQTSRGADGVAEYLQIPFVSICSAVVLNADSSIPPVFMPWHYRPNSLLGNMRNWMGYQLLYYISKPISRVLSSYRKQWGLPLHPNPNDDYSSLAQISQQPKGFEFPRTDLPPYFHFTGPYHSEEHREEIGFPWEKLSSDKPLVYASLGTIQNKAESTFHIIADACKNLNIQLVLSLGGSGDKTMLPSLPGNPIVVNYAPQLELLKRATLMITHAGLNSTLEALTNGVPLVAIPITSDQPGVAARIAWTGVGEVVHIFRLTAPRLTEAIKKVLEDKSYKEKALKMQESIKKSGGVDLAVKIIEQVAATGKPVLPNQV
ncbi:glycosyltransferase [Candidatus Nitrosacidococcus tergens]|uniref:Glucuronosyltransferase n=1 Tax=Candidatus Nitrosacidococcus tergens TaxID=553981 RepID=A0A7G1Q9T5_9GAMM|nr:glycosyltransferase [Candidatus Nitrosacidococcus tergens]CAB1275991.1 glucuronosyltransferase [Candidatus Nitrosacidococcus tergens]